MYTFQIIGETENKLRIQEERRKSKIIEINDIKITYLLMQIKVTMSGPIAKTLYTLHHLVLLCP